EHRLVSEPLIPVGAAVAAISQRVAAWAAPMPVSAAAFDVADLRRHADAPAAYDATGAELEEQPRRQRAAVLGAHQHLAAFDVLVRGRLQPLAVEALQGGLVHADAAAAGSGDF